MLLFLLSLMYQSTQWPLANLQERHHNYTASYDTGLFGQTKYNIDSWAWLLSTLPHQGDSTLINHRKILTKHQKCVCCAEG